MKIGILGTGVVGEAIATALVNKGHHVRMGSRAGGSEKARAWVKRSGDKASEDTFAAAALYGDLVFICLNGQYTLGALSSIAAADIAGKIVIDITNPLDLTGGMPARIMEKFSGSTSLGEEVQKALLGAFVVKTLNTINYNLMVDARKVAGGDHDLYLCGNDANAKNIVKHFLVDNFYWKANHLIDLGSIESARTMEAIVPFWLLVYRTQGTALFNFRIVH